MSLPSAERMISGGDETRLLIDESPYIFLPSLAQIFGDTCGLVLQQLHYVAKHPYFEGERLETQWKDGLFYVQIPAFMWWDSIEGFLRHVAKRTLERKVGELVKTGALRVADRVGHYRDDLNHKWYAIDYGKLRQLEVEHRENFDRCKAQRQKERAELEISSRGTAKWRPPSGKDTSGKIGDWCPLLSEDVTESAPSKPRKKDESQTLRQNGASLPPTNLALEPCDNLALEPCDNLALEPCDNLALEPCDNLARLPYIQEQQQKQEEKQKTPKADSTSRMTAVGGIVCSVLNSDNVVVPDQTNSLIPQNSDEKKDVLKRAHRELVADGVLSKQAYILLAEYGIDVCMAALDESGGIENLSAHLPKGPQMAPNGPQTASKPTAATPTPSAPLPRAVAHESDVGDVEAHLVSQFIQAGFKPASKAAEFVARHGVQECALQLAHLGDATRPNPGGYLRQAVVGRYRFGDTAQNAAPVAPRLTEAQIAARDAAENDALDAQIAKSGEGARIETLAKRMLGAMPSDDATLTLQKRVVIRRVNEIGFDQAEADWADFEADRAAHLQQQDATKEKAA